MMGMWVDVHDYGANDVKEESKAVKEVSKAGTEKESKIADVANQPVDKDTFRYIEGMREFFKNNKEVAGKLDQDRKQLFTSEYSPNDANLRFAERVSRLEQVVGDLQKKLQGGIQWRIEENLNYWRLVFPHGTFTPSDSV